MIMDALGVNGAGSQNMDSQQQDKCVGRRQVMSRAVIAARLAIGGVESNPGPKNTNQAATKKGKENAEITSLVLTEPKTSTSQDVEGKIAEATAFTLTTESITSTETTSQNTSESSSTQHVTLEGLQQQYEEQIKINSRLNEQLQVLQRDLTSQQGQITDTEYREYFEYFNSFYSDEVSGEKGCQGRTQLVVLEKQLHTLEQQLVEYRKSHLTHQAEEIAKIELQIQVIKLELHTEYTSMWHESKWCKGGEEKRKQFQIQWSLFQKKYQHDQCKRLAEQRRKEQICEAEKKALKEELSKANSKVAHLEKLIMLAETRDKSCKQEKAKLQKELDDLRREKSDAVYKQRIEIEKLHQEFVIEVKRVEEQTLILVNVDWKREKELLISKYEMMIRELNAVIRERDTTIRVTITRHETLYNKLQSQLSEDKITYDQTVASLTIKWKEEEEKCSRLQVELKRLEVQFKRDNDYFDRLIDDLNSKWNADLDLYKRKEQEWELLYADLRVKMSPVSFSHDSLKISWTNERNEYKKRMNDLQLLVDKLQEEKNTLAIQNEFQAHKLSVELGEHSSTCSFKQSYEIEKQRLHAATLEIQTFERQENFLQDKRYREALEQLQITEKKYKHCSKEFALVVSKNQELTLGSERKDRELAALRKELQETSKVTKEVCCSETSAPLTSYEREILHLRNKIDVKRTSLSTSTVTCDASHKPSLSYESYYGSVSGSGFTSSPYDYSTSTFDLGVDSGMTFGGSYKIPDVCDDAFYLRYNVY